LIVPDKNDLRLSCSCEDLNGDEPINPPVLTDFFNGAPPAVAAMAVPPPGGTSAVVVVVVVGGVTPSADAPPSGLMSGFNNLLVYDPVEPDKPANDPVDDRFHPPTIPFLQPDLLPPAASRSSPSSSSSSSTACSNLSA
jgi:hypothetical protein